MYSTDTAFTQHKHDKYTLQTKGQKPADEEIFERHVKLQADSRRIRGARNSIRIFFGQKNWYQSRPHMRFIVTMAL